MANSFKPTRWIFIILISTDEQTHSEVDWHKARQLNEKANVLPLSKVSTFPYYVHVLYEQQQACIKVITAL